MQYRVYKSLDKTNSLFGIKGSYQKYAIAGIPVGGLVGVLVGSFLGSLVGTIVALAVIVGVYVAILSIQSRFSERERVRWFCSHRLPDYIVVPPHILRKYCSFIVKEKGQKPFRSK